MTHLPLEAEDVAKFIKICRLMESSSDGERSAAAGLATQFLRQRGLNWGELLEPLRFRLDQESGEASSSSVLPHRQAARECLASGESWNAWELNFLTNIAHQRRAPTDRQAARLTELHDRAQAARKAA